MHHLRTVILLLLLWLTSCSEGATVDSIPAGHETALAAPQRPLLKVVKQEMDGGLLVWGYVSVLDPVQALQASDAYEVGEYVRSLSVYIEIRRGTERLQQSFFHRWMARSTPFDVKGQVNIDVLDSATSRPFEFIITPLTTTGWSGVTDEQDLEVVAVSG